ncbi:uncharacterized protein A1O5_11087 [Cladophialophora psammophila CBS 110553]|uniref:Glycosyl hydrolase family 13 catalytic domain-containing protein n=1 Tax=Cladophialophora psammophila CBS 110553 TaxID=1182543 RepID=W9WML0_9EURO|nr:uncharacterized protein A1O5_11087 [Cladophialophora psammophila CBS 110553]EXJ65846.1 hypothetical protein A1O5_11087 [Cladophialophora psammophila CBS 110553]
MHRWSSLVRTISGSGKVPESEDPRPNENKTLFQAFEWYLPAPPGDSALPNASHYSILTALLPHLSALGISHIWIPPGCKATSVHDNGYGIYDLWDLGEFDAKKNGKPSRTKWGHKAELEVFCAKAKELEIDVLWDAVLNHKASADGKEASCGVKVDSHDRTKAISKPYELETWTKFTFPGRGTKYSDMKYNWRHFSGIDYDSRRKDHAIFKLIGEGKRSDWAHDVSKELGNYDYLMFADLDHSHSAVRSDILNWGAWITSLLNLGGFRLDAIKHYSLSFLADFLSHLDTTTSQGKRLFYVGEYWDSNVFTLESVIKRCHGRLNLFDVQLVYTFSDFSKGRKHDLRTIFDGSLVQRDHGHAVTFVANHDTQDTQALAAPVEEWFIPLAYALILLRHDGGTPCVFWGDIFGNHGPRPRLPACGGKLARLISARKLYAHGPQRDYLDLEDCIGWTRLGHKSKANGAGLAVIMTNSWDRRSKRMFVGHRHIGEKWRDILDWEDREVVIDSRGFGKFPVGHRSVGVWTHEKAPDFEKSISFTFPRLGHSAAAPDPNKLPA